jgi:hypothetical protein
VNEFRLRLVLALALASTVLTATGVVAATGYDGSWNAFTGGAPAASAGGYTLAAAIGQPAAGAVQGGYAVTSGVLAAFASAPVAPPGENKTFLPLVDR